MSDSDYASIAAAHQLLPDPPDSAGWESELKSAVAPSVVPASQEHAIASLACDLKGLPPAERRVAPWRYVLSAAPGAREGSSRGVHFNGHAPPPVYDTQGEDCVPLARAGHTFESGNEALRRFM
jgi:hypothetical protein